jgi:predicted amidohydrolase YtcJ
MDMGLTAGFGTPHVRFMGIKFVMDGSTGGHTAAFSQPYQGEPDQFGELYFDPEILREDLLRAAKSGVQVSIHAIGDRAIEMALSAIEYVNEQGVDTRPLRYRLEHLESPTPDQIQRIKKLNLVVGLSSAFIYSLGDSHLSALGYDRLVDAFPAKPLMDEGIVIACNSDCPVCDVNPMLGIYSMVTRTTQAGQSFGGKKEAISRLAALKSYTKNAAYVLCSEKTSGTLTPGKYADLTVFEEDFLNVPDEKLKDVQVYMTVSGGEIVYKKN